MLAVNRFVAKLPSSPPMTHARRAMMLYLPR